MGRRRALLIGNWEYADPAKILHPLRGPEHDLIALEAALTHVDYGLFEPADITVERNLTAREISTSLETFLNQADRDDFLLVYYSGHGERLPMQQLGLCGTDVNSDTLSSTCFDTRNVSEWLKTTASVSSTVIVLDCCYAGQMKGSTATDELVEKSFEPGTAVLMSGGNEPAKDAADDGHPSPFTAALVEALVDPELEGDERGHLSFGAVFERLGHVRPKPTQRINGQGKLPLARRPPTTVEQTELSFWREDQEVRQFDVCFTDDGVTVRHAGKPVGERTLADFGPSRQAAVRRLAQLADAVVRLPDYNDDDTWETAVRKSWECAGTNMFDAVIPAALRDAIASDGDESGRTLLKLTLHFEGPGGKALEPYPWEYLHLGDQADGMFARPLGLRRGILIERAPEVATPRPPPRSGSRALAIVNGLGPGMRERLADDVERLDRAAGLKIVADQQGTAATWGGFLEALQQQPEYLVLFLPIKRLRHNLVQLGFASSANDDPDWRPIAEVTERVRTDVGGLEVLVFASFAGPPGRDSFRGTLEFAQYYAARQLGPIVFGCHARGFEKFFDEEANVGFTTLLLEALSRGHALDRSVYYARDRVMDLARDENRRRFGVPGYYGQTEPDPARTVKRAAPATTTRGAAGGGLAQESS